MSLDFSTLIWILIAAMALQPLIMGRLVLPEARTGIRAHEKSHGSARHHDDPSAGEAQPLRVQRVPPH